MTRPDGTMLDPRIQAAHRDFMTSRIDRRTMLARAVTAGAAGMTLAGLAAARRTGAQTPEGTVTPGSTLTVPADIRTDLAGQTVRATLFDQSSPDNDWMNAAIATFSQATGITVEYIPNETDSSATLQRYRQLFAAGATDVDVYTLDIVWPGLFADFALDLGPTLGSSISQSFEAIVGANTLDGKVIGSPWYTDAGLLFYRTDLLEKYGLAVPTTWDELGTAAQAIQQGELATNPNFTGFTWQGAAAEALTCNGLEWQYSNGGGTIIDGEGTITVNNEQAIAAFERARGWINTVTPQAVVNQTEPDTLNIWTSGSAAFARNWPYMYASSQVAGSAVAGNIGVTGLPMGTGEGASSAATLGGWQLMVGANSQAPDAAMEFVRFVTSPEAQRSFAIERNHLPTIASVYQDADVLAANPYYADLLPVFQGGAVARPSTVTGENYGDISQIYYQQLNAVLNGSVSAADAAARMESDMEGVLSGL